MVIWLHYCGPMAVMVSLWHGGTVCCLLSLKRSVPTSMARQSTLAEGYIRGKLFISWYPGDRQKRRSQRGKGRDQIRSPRLYPHDLPHLLFLSPPIKLWSYQWIHSFDEVRFLMIQSFLRSLSAGNWVLRIQKHHVSFRGTNCNHNLLYKAGNDGTCL